MEPLLPPGFEEETPEQEATSNLASAADTIRRLREGERLRPDDKLLSIARVELEILVRAYEDEREHRNNLPAELIEERESAASYKRVNAQLRAEMESRVEAGAAVWRERFTKTEADIHIAAARKLARGNHIAFYVAVATFVSAVSILAFSFVRPLSFDHDVISAVVGAMFLCALGSPVVAFAAYKDGKTADERLAHVLRRNGRGDL